MTNRINKGFAGVYYNPHVNLKTMVNDGMPELAEDGRKLKYGVVSVDNMVKDLTTWHNFFLAGRMQKMILHILEEKHEPVYEAIDTNLQKAMQTAVFLNAHSDTFTRRELFRDMISFSYTGDVRMRFKMENPKKIDNILDGSYDDLSALYAQYLEKLQQDDILI